MCLDYAWSNIKTEVAKACGSMAKFTLIKYRRTIQTAMKTYLEKKKLLQIGGKCVTAVIDETVVGVDHGMKCRKKQGVPHGNPKDVMKKVRQKG